MRNLALVLVVVAGCTHTFTRDAVQPNPVVAANDPTARTSERITITRNDVDLVVPTSQIDARDPETPSVTAEYGPMVTNDKVTSYGSYFRWPLQTSASWTMVSRDDLRFHIAIDHKWSDYVDLAEWGAELVDDQGHVYKPTKVENVRARILYGAKPSEAALTIYRGNGDLVFDAPGLLTANARWIKLVLNHGVDKFEYTWKFQAAVATR
ncbi:MAG TPA: hypothetical protein VGG28_18270 [Kofleriaceae bacterium]|jgi:hypothetical protein